MKPPSLLWLFFKYSKPLSSTLGSMSMPKLSAATRACTAHTVVAPSSRLGVPGVYHQPPEVDWFLAISLTDRATTAPLTFTLAVDPANHGVVVQRTSDQAAAYQRAELTVNGTDLGQWLEPLGNPSHRWLDDDYPLPPALTAGATQVTVTIAPVAGWPAWSAASYRAVSIS